LHTSLWVPPPLEDGNESNCLQAPLILHAFEPLVVFLYRAQNTNADLQAPILPSLLQQMFVPLIVFRYKTRNTNASLRAPPLWVLLPLRVPTMRQEFSLSESHVHCFAVGSNPHSKATVNQLHCRNFSHSKARSLQVPLMGLPPLENNATGLPNHSRDKPTTPMIEISTPKMRDHIN